MNFFDHLNAIYQNQSPDYYDNLSDSDKKSFNEYMINRGISMNMFQVEVANEAQRYYNELRGRELYLFYSNLIPKRKQFNKWVKATKSNEYDDWLIELVAHHYEVSKLEATKYLDIYFSTDDGKKSLRSFLEGYGKDNKTIKKLKI